MNDTIKILIIIILMSIFMASSVFAQNRPVPSLDRQLGRLNRQEALLRRNYVRDTEQGIYRYDLEHEIRQVHLRQESTARMIMFPDLIEVD